jgi:hypothetical protein
MSGTREQLQGWSQEVSGGVLRIAVVSPLDVVRGSGCLAQGDGQCRVVVPVMVATPAAPRPLGLRAPAPCR